MISVVTKDLQDTPLTIPTVGKVSVLVFISPYCASCKKLVADLDRYWRRFDPNRVAVIGVVLDADREAAVELKSKVKVDFPWTINYAQEVADFFQVQSVPSVFLIDERGGLSMTADGATGDSERILQRVHALLEE
jgi:thioredoxin-related protein